MSNQPGVFGTCFETSATSALLDGDEHRAPLAEARPHLRRRAGERLVVDEVGDVALVPVVVRRGVEERAAELDELGRRPAEEAEERERQLEVVDDGRPAEAGGPTEGDADAAGDRVLRVLAGREL